MTVDLVAFVRARLDEREEVARFAATYTGSDWVLVDNPPRTHKWDQVVPEVIGDGELVARCDFEGGGPFCADHIVLNDPARVLAEVEAMRRIVELLNPWFPEDEHGVPSTAGLGGAGEVWLDALRLLALPDAGHRDYREEWKP